MTRHNRGFTLVELTLAMTYISMLMLSIAMLTLQISSIYNQGLTLRDVDQIGQSVTSDMQRTLSTSSQSKVSTALRNDGGRLCAGGVVYAWNYGNDIDTDHTVFNVYVSGKQQAIRLVKFSTAGKEFCQTNSSGAYEKIPDTATELITSGGRNLAIQAFSMDTPVILGGGQSMYSLHLTLGTNTTEVINGEGCELPKTLVDDQYCAVNEFNFVARAGNAEK